MNMAPPNSQRPSAPKHFTNGTGPPPVNDGEPTINKKKQKRRQKLAARLAAEQSTLTSSSDAHDQIPNGHPSSLHKAYEQSTPKPRAGTIDSLDYEPSDLDENYESREGDDRFYSEEDGG